LRGNSVLFDLAQLLEAGISPAEATERLLSDGTEKDPALEDLASAFRKGRSIADALSGAGFATKLETEILRSAEQSGKLSEALHLVANNFEKRKLRTHALRLRLWLPNFLVFIALVVGVVRDVTAGAAIGASIVQATFVIVVIFCITQMTLRATARDASRWLSFGWRWRLQNTSTLFRRFFEHTFYTMFLWQAQAGVDPISGARSLTSALDAPSYRRSLRRYVDKLNRGESVVDALRDAELLVPGELAEVINTGEHSGRLAPALEHYLDIQALSLERKANTIFAWIPRVYYFVVIIISAGSLI
jgi:type II secretory pathway component PulF